jgi:3-keto-disaccharide hydrolase
VQLHVEWATPAEVAGTGQERGNSGVFLMQRYEIQVLDSYGNQTYPDGQAGAIYGQMPPQVNASRPPGVWQTYDIVFIAPRFGADGSVTSPARATVVHNGIVVQHDVPLIGATAHRVVGVYQRHREAEPLMLQDHGNPVRYRNIWVRRLGGGR